MLEASDHSSALGLIVSFEMKATRDSGLSDNEAGSYMALQCTSTTVHSDLVANVCTFLPTDSFCHRTDPLSWMLIAPLTTILVHVQLS